MRSFIHSRPENRTPDGADEQRPLSISLQETAGFSPRSFIWVGSAGCLLPVLIFFNLIFGWLFFPLHTWFLLELALIGILFLSSIFTMRKIVSGSNSRRQDGVIDVEGEVVEEREKIGENQKKHN